MLVIGLTGGVASGKTLVSRGFADRGIPIVDADILAREVVAPGTDGLKAVVAAFGDTVLDPAGQLDRKELRNRIFIDEAARKTLENILHPLIRDAMDKQVHAFGNAGEAVVVTVIPLLIETGQQVHCDRVLVVDAPAEMQVTRLCRRDEIDRAAATAMLANQAGRWDRLQHADDVIANGDDTPPETAIDCQIDAIMRKYWKMTMATEVDQAR